MSEVISGPSLAGGGAGWVLDEITNCEEKRDGEECTSRALHALNVSRRENGVARENIPD